MSGRQPANPLQWISQGRADAYLQRAGPTLDEGRKGALDLPFAGDGEDFDLLPHGRSRSPDLRDKRLGKRPFGIDEHGNARGSRPQLTQEPKLLRRKFHRHEADTSDVAAGPVEVGDEAVPDRVAPGHKDDRHRRGCGLGCDRRRGIADDQGYLPAKKVRYQKRQPSLILGRAVLDRNVPALDEACFLQALAQHSHVMLPAWQEPHHRHCRLLRARPERPRRRAADERDEVALPHSITSSARASSVAGTSIPSALAVLRLITISNLVGCWTGKSAGVAPFKILTTYVAATSRASLHLLLTQLIGQVSGLSDRERHDG